MKKLLLAAIVSTAIATPAFAQNAGTTVGDSSSAYAGSNSVAIPLSGTVNRACSLSAFLNGPFNALDMRSTAVQGAESVSAICNYGGTATVSFASANLGQMKSGNNGVAYKVIISGQGNVVGPVSLASPIAINGWPAVANAVQTRSISVQLDAPATIAGTYTDTITATVTPN